MGNVGEVTYKVRIGGEGTGDGLLFLYENNNWVVTGEMLTVLVGFYHRVARRI